MYTNTHTHKTHQVHLLVLGVVHLQDPLELGLDLREVTQVLVQANGITLLSSQARHGLTAHFMVCVCLCAAHSCCVNEHLSSQYL